MKKNRGLPCRKVRTLLQDLHDRKEEPEGEIAAHLKGCRGCAAFLDFLTRLGEEVRGSVEEPVVHLAEPDYAAILQKADEEKSTRWARRAGRISLLHRRIAIPAAAALAISIGASSGFLGITAHREKAALRESMDSFVDSLFAVPPLEGAEYAAAGSPGISGNDLVGNGNGLEGWLEEIASSRAYLEE